ncbi:MAG TPA: hypothetical protein VEK07_20960 [Polyangiaceae bacterium]|nr:hypothetical protein [Polyangiaceae bacterium]
MSANERIETVIMSTDSIDRTPPPARVRALRRIPTTAAVEEIEGPESRIADFARALAERIMARPVTAGVLAVGVGFVVGGALSCRAGRMALAAAGRHVLRELLKQVL